MAIDQPSDEGPDGGNGGNGGNGGYQGRGEFRSGPRAGTALISGITFTNKPVVYANVDGMAIFEADIALGTVAEIEAAQSAAAEAAAAAPEGATRSIGISGARFRWPDCKVPYEIDPALPNQSRVTDAIAHWESKTAIRFPLRTAANASTFPNWVRFTDAGGCWSMVGMQGGQQTISLGAGCTTGNAIHEMGHAVGLWHEQSREDRDLFVTVNFANITAGMEHNFDQHIADGDDLGGYDYGSIMHYPRGAFSKNGQDTIVPKNPASAQIGQRDGLSPGDIAGVKALYPRCGVIVKQVFRDPGPNFKKVLDDQKFKKVRDDIVVRPKSLVADLTINPGGPVKFDAHPQPGGLIGRPGALRPFTMSTPHQAALGGADLGGFDEAEAVAFLSDLEAQLLEIEAAIAAALAAAAQGAAEAARLRQQADALAATMQEALDALGGAGGQ